MVGCSINYFATWSLEYIVEEAEKKFIHVIQHNNIT